MRVVRRFTLAAALCAATFIQASHSWAHGQDEGGHKVARLGKFQMESGGVLDELKITYVTHGRLNAAKSNAILVLHGFGANHHGFDGLIGPGKPLDTNRYFIVSPDQLGATQAGPEHSSSPTSSGLKMKFPLYYHRDMVRAQHLLLTRALSIETVRAVLGISMGASQAVQMAVSYPDFADGIVPIVGGPLYGNESRLWNYHLQSIIEGCAAWQDGQYSANSPECAGAALTTLMHYFFSREWWDANMTSAASFDGFRKAWWGLYLGVQDMRDVYYLSKAFERSSIGETPGFDGNLEKALRSVKARSMFVYSPKDMFFLPKNIEAIVKMMRGARTVAIDSDTGHLICCGVDPGAYWILGETIRGFLAELDVVAAK